MIKNLFELDHDSISRYQPNQDQVEKKIMEIKENLS